MDAIGHHADQTIEVRRDLITATAAVAGFSSFVFGLLTNLPVALAYVFSFRRGCCFGKLLADLS
jgi:xanthine/uracil/vitamin C permease (AzgA family)